MEAKVRLNPEAVNLQNALSLPPALVKAGNGARFLNAFVETEGVDVSGSRGSFSIEIGENASIDLLLKRASTDDRMDRKLLYTFLLNILTIGSVKEAKPEPGRSTRIFMPYSKREEFSEAFNILWAGSSELNLVFTRNPVCGNGIIDGGEKCDDGNSNNADGCNDSCEKPGTPKVDLHLRPPPPDDASEGFAVARPPAAAKDDDDKKPFYATWWFWTIVGAVVAVGAGTGIYLATRGGGEENGNGPEPKPEPTHPTRPSECRPDNKGNVPEDCGGEVVGGN